MQEVIFESKLLKDGHLYCPKNKLSLLSNFKGPLYATDSEIEMAAVADQAEEFLSDQELEYYMNLN